MIAVEAKAFVAMDLSFSVEEHAFRDQVRSFIRDALPADIAAKVGAGYPAEKDDINRWQQILHKRGWSAPSWPVAHGGTGWSALQRYIFEEELAFADTPESVPFGLQMVGPVIYTFGTAAQQERFLPPILTGDEWWCQGYSEPDSGSDLASLQTRAVADGRHYIVNGAKTWTTMAHLSDWMFCLVRTRGEGKPQEGISFLLIDMTSPGIDVQPIITIDGSHHVNNVFFTDVAVPVENRIGEENMGWTYAKFLLGHERMGIAEVGRSKQRLRRLKQIAAAEVSSGQALISDADFSRQISALEVDLMALEYTNLRFLAVEAAGGTIGAEASMLKIRGSEVRQRIAELCVDAMGYYAAPYDPAAFSPGHNEGPIGPVHGNGVTHEYLYGRAASIYGGTNEIQKGIIAKMVLGL